MKRLIVGILAAAAVSTATYASASALAVNGGTIQSGGSGVTCQNGELKANWGLETDSNTVNDVRVTGIDANCVGADMFVKVAGKKYTGALDTTKNSNFKLESGGTTYQVTIPFGSGVDPASIDNVHIWIEG